MDRQILENKIKLEKSILNKEQQTEFLDMLIKKREAFSLQDEIGTCPYLRSDCNCVTKPRSLCGHTPFVKNRKRLFKEKWIDWNDWGSSRRDSRDSVLQYFWSRENNRIYTGWSPTLESLMKG